MNTHVLILLVGFIVLISGCVTSASLTPEHVLEQKDSLLDQRISVRGTADTGSLICTLMACTQDNPCCNACSGNLVLKGVAEKIDIRGENIGCSGNECTQVCQPLEKGKEYIVSGSWKVESGEYFLELENFEERK